jgi:hypothetical protein
VTSRDGEVVDGVQLVKAHSQAWSASWIAPWSKEEEWPERCGCRWASDYDGRDDLLRVKLKKQAREERWRTGNRGRPKGGDGVVSPRWNRRRTSSGSATSDEKFGWHGGELSERKREERRRGLWVFYSRPWRGEGVGFWGEGGDRTVGESSVFS